MADEITKEEKIEALKPFLPEGQSAQVYYGRVSLLMGQSKDGKYRPFEDIYNFLYVANKTGLDPFVKQIYAVYRWNAIAQREVMTIQTGIDGMRLVAQRTGTYAGQDDVIFDPSDEGAPTPRKASVTVYKMMNSTRVAFTASARWSEYAQHTKEGKPMGLWERMPYLMLGKCAESLALRKAFPNELSGIYTTEEMAQARNAEKVIPTNEVTTPASESSSTGSKHTETATSQAVNESSKTEEQIMNESIDATLDEAAGLTKVDNVIEKAREEHPWLNKKPTTKE